MEKKIAVVTIGGAGSLSESQKIQLTNKLKSIGTAVVILDESFTPPPEHTSYEIKTLATPIKPSYCFVDDNKHKNQHWAKRGKNIKR